MNTLLSLKTMMSYDTGKFLFLANTRNVVAYQVALLYILLAVHWSKGTIIP